MLDLRPRYSTPEVKAIERLVGKHYTLEGPLRCRLLQRGLNDVYRVTADNGKAHIFRLSHRRARGPADVRTETAFLTHLAERGVPVASPIATRDGAFSVEAEAPEGVRSGVLFQAAEGRDSGAGDGRANGRTLALLHNAAETFYAEGALYRLDLDHLLHRPLARIADSGVVEDKAVLSDLESIAARTAKAIEASGNLTWTHCHGDCHGFNARIDAAGQAVFFDFDDGGPGYLSYDLSVFLWANVSFGRTLTPAWDAFIEGYRAVRPISSDDFEAAIRFVIVRHFWLMGEYASRADEWGSNTVGWIAQQAGFLKSWEIEQLTDRLF